MGYSVTQEPGTIVGTGQPIIFTVYDTDVAGTVYKYKYLCDIYINGSKIARLKQSPNASDVGIFDISRVVNSFLSPTLVNQGITTNSIHTLPLGDAGDPYSTNDSTLESVICKFGDEQSTSATTSPTVTADRITESTRYAFQGAVPYNAGINYDFDEFTPDDSAARFLTDMPDYTIQNETIPTSNNEWRTMAFINDGTSGAINRVYVNIYNSSDVLLNTSNDYFDNTAANGGQAPASVSADTERILYVGVGIKNLNVQSLHTDMRLSNHATASYYEVYGTNSSDAQKTTKYRFSVDGNECVFPMVELAWKNRLGQWDYFTLKKKNTKTLNTTRTSMERTLGTYNATTYAENSFDRGTATLSADAIYSETANTDYLTEKQAEWIEELFTSKNVYMIDTQQDIWSKASGTNISADAPNVIPVVITSATYTKKTAVNDKCQIQYTLEYKYSKNQRVGI